MFLERLHLQSFKGFRDFTVDLPQITCLVGLNSSGKTSILQAIRLLYDILVRVFGGADRPDFSAPKWQWLPEKALDRASPGDPAAVWLLKRTSEPCAVRAMLSGGIEVSLNVIGPARYELELLRGEASLRKSMEEPRSRQVVESLFKLKPMYVPPIGSLSPVEQFLHKGTLRTKLDEGRESECWRSHLQWLWNDGDKDTFDSVVALVRRYLPGAVMKRPRLSGEGAPVVLVEFEEEGVAFDIGISGGGLRTLLNLAVVLRFADSRCLLLDEPDSHLHSTLQRAVAQMLVDYAVEENRQVIVATHAPDFIAEFPTDSIVWIDRRQDGGKRCEALGRVLVDLGAISKPDAVRAYGADKVLFVEGTLDAKVLGRLVSLANGRNPFDDPSVIVAKLPNGKGDIAHLGTLPGFLREAWKAETTVACVVDNDYELAPDSTQTAAAPGETLVLRLGVKEAENYLIAPAVIKAALDQAATRWLERTGEQPGVPTEEEVRAKLNSLLQLPEVERLVRNQLRPRLRRKLPNNLDDSTREERGDQCFDELWSNESWRTANCPGKQVRAQLRSWCQSEYKLTLTDDDLVAGLVQCPPDLARIAEQLEAHFYGSTAAG